jgi:hypothetical protein
MIISLAIGVSVTLLAAQVVHARGFGGAHCGGGYSGGGYHSGGYHGGSYSGGESRGGYSRDESRGGYPGGESRGGYSGGGQPGNEHSGAEGAAAGHAATERNEPKYSGAEGAAAGHAATERNEPNYSGAQGAAAGYAAGNRNSSMVAAGHVALPTDAGYGMTAAVAGSAAHVGYHQTAPVSGSVYAARGAAVRNSYNGAGMYGQGWYGAHPGAWNPSGWTAGRVWGAATWPSVGAWYGFGSAQPVYYDYGNNISYQGDQVCYGDQPVATADQYYQQASSLAAAAPSPDPDSGEWMPLGVFALVQNDQSDPHYIVQLAVNKSGALRGNYSDLISGTNVLIQGSVDKKSQRVAWTVGDNKRTVGETGLFNLTKDEAPVLIHLGKDKTQQWTLVRLKQPEQAGGEN